MPVLSYFRSCSNDLSYSSPYPYPQLAYFLWKHPYICLGLLRAVSGKEKGEMETMQPLAPGCTGYTERERNSRDG